MSLCVPGRRHLRRQQVNGCPPTGPEGSRRVFSIVGALVAVARGLCNCVIPRLLLALPEGPTLLVRALWYNAAVALVQLSRLCQSVGQNLQHHSPSLHESGAAPEAFRDPTRFASTLSLKGTIPRP